MATTVKIDGGEAKSIVNDLVVYDNDEPILIIMSKGDHTLVCSAAAGSELFEQYCRNLGLRAPKCEVHGARLG